MMISVFFEQGHFQDFAQVFAEWPSTHTEKRMWSTAKSCAHCVLWAVLCRPSGRIGFAHASGGLCGIRWAIRQGGGDFPEWLLGNPQVIYQIYQDSQISPSKISHFRILAQIITKDLTPQDFSSNIKELAPQVLACQSLNQLRYVENQH